jgi:hypothetical protein
MPRPLTLALALLGPIALAGCSSSEPTNPHAHLQEQIERFLLHLNNDNETERWRDGLIEIGRRSPTSRDVLLEELTQAYDQSMAYGGHGVRILRFTGRYRVMEIVGALGNSPRGRALLQRGLEEGHRVSIAAAAALLAWGDSSAASVLEEQLQQFPEGDPDREKARSALGQAQGQAAVATAPADGSPG